MPEAAEPRAILEAVGQAPDGDIRLGLAALALAALDRPGAGLGRYLDHLAELAADVAARAAGGDCGPEDHARALAAVLAEGHGYGGDRLTYDDPQNANLMRVIDRKKGLPVALGILYLDAGLAQGWAIAGLNFPGHFVVGLEAGAARLVLDPFSGGRLLDIDHLRELLRRLAGPDAPLMPAHALPVGRREVLLRLNNNLKGRALAAGQAERAAQVMERMTWIAPRAAPLWREMAELQTRLGNLGRAAEALNRVLELAESDVQRHEAATALQALKRRVN